MKLENNRYICQESKFVIVMCCKAIIVYSDYSPSLSFSRSFFFYISLDIRLTSTYEVETGVLLCPFAPLRGTGVVFIHIATAAQKRNSTGQHPKIPG
jgi:hypothetical protein